MSISAFTRVPSYTSLVEVVQVYLNRYDEDTKNTIPFFINAAEKTILRQLRMPSMERMVKFNLQDDGDVTSGFVNLPSDYLEMKVVWVEGKDATTLQRVTFDELIRQDNFLVMQGRPEQTSPMNWAINADRMYIRPIMPEREIYMTYYADVPEVSENVEGNVLLELAPDAFAFLAIAEGFRFLMEEGKADYWESQGFKRLNQIMQQVENAEYSGSPLTISPV